MSMFTSASANVRLGRFNCTVIASGAAWLLAPHPTCLSPVSVRAANPNPAIQAPTQVSPASKQPTTDEVDRYNLRGRVLDPNGKPVSGAKLYVCGSWSVGSGPVSCPGRGQVRAITGPDGAFRFAVDRVEMDRSDWVVAALGDYGPDWVSLTRLDLAGMLPDLRLAKDDVAIEGRVLDLESQPLEGISVRVLRILKAPGEDLTAYVRCWSAVRPYRNFGVLREPGPIGYESGVMSSLNVAQSVKTGADGRFRLTGCGRERVAVLALEGAGLERRVIDVATRSQFPKELAALACGAKADFLLAPGKAITGTVRQSGSGKPASGVEVTCASGQSLEPARSTTDAQGQYRLEGVPKSKQYIVVAQGGPYIRMSQTIEDPAGSESVRTDFVVERGLQVCGRLIDKATGRPVAGYVEYQACTNNSHLKEYPSYLRLPPEDIERVRIDRDGLFRVAALPGPGTIMARSWENRFTNGYSWPVHCTQVPGSVSYTEGVHSLVEINPAENSADTLRCTIALDPGQTLAGKVVGPDGKPVPGTLAWGVTPAYGTFDLDLGMPALAADGSFTARGLDPQKPRYLFFWHKEKGLARAVLVHGDEPGPLTVRLEPLGAVSGQLVDEDGKPLADASANASFTILLKQSIDRSLIPYGLAVGNYMGDLVHLPAVTLDAQGRFRIPKLVAGLHYGLGFGSKMRPLGRMEFTASGGSQSLGTISVKQLPFRY